MKNKTPGGEETLKWINWFLILSVIFNCKSGFGRGSAEAAFLLEAERAYESIVSYDENIEIDFEEIEKLYRRDKLLAPVKRFFDKTAFFIRSVSMKDDADAYCLYFFYTGQRGLFPPEGIREAEMYLMPFTEEEARAYDMGFREDACFSALVRAEEAGQKGLAPENGFEPYLDDFAPVPVSENAAFLPDAVQEAVWLLETEGEISAPVFDARGIVYARLVSFS